MLARRQSVLANPSGPGGGRPKVTTGSLPQPKKSHSLWLPCPTRSPEFSQSAGCPLEGFTWALRTSSLSSLESVHVAVLWVGQVLNCHSNRHI